MARIYFIFLTLLFNIGFKCIAQDLYSFGNYTYKIEDETKKEICLYTYSDNGETSSLMIPSIIEHEGESYSVTKIKGPITQQTGYSKGFIQENCRVVDIHFPSSLTNISSQITRELNTIKSAIFENGDNLSINTTGAFYFNLTPFSLDYVIIFQNSKKKITSTQLVGTSNSSKFLENSITISYNDGTSEAVSMFLYYVKKQHDTFDNISFNYLISSLQERGTDLNTISIIDLSSVSTSFTISFDENPANILPFGAKVITKKSGTFTSTNIPDKVNFTAPSSDITANISYSRDDTQNWNSVCLPFDIKESDFGNDVCKIYTVSSATASEIYLTRVEDDETVVPAGTPCFINSVIDQWVLSLSNVTISSNVTPKTIDVDNNWQVIGSFTTQTIGAGKYKLNSNGDAFGITTSDAATVMPFRCYIATTSSNAPARLNVNFVEEASITLVPNDAVPQRVELYDLLGRPQKEGTKGIFIKSTR